MNEREIKSIKDHIKTTKNNIFATFKVEDISNLVICYEQLLQEIQKLKEQLQQRDEVIIKIKNKIEEMKIEFELNNYVTDFIKKLDNELQIIDKVGGNE